MLLLRLLLVMVRLGYSLVLLVRSLLLLSVGLLLLLLLPIGSCSRSLAKRIVCCCSSFGRLLIYRRPTTSSVSRASVLVFSRCRSYCGFGSSIACCCR